MREEEERALTPVGIAEFRRPDLVARENCSHAGREYWRERNFSASNRPRLSFRSERFGSPGSIPRENTMVSFLSLPAERPKELYHRSPF